MCQIYSWENVKSKKQTCLLFVQLKIDKISIKLVLQIHQEAKRFGKVYNIKVVCAYGGGNLWEQCKACEEGAEIIVATPVSV